MSVRAEYIHAANAGCNYVNELDLAKEIYIENPDDENVLVISYDEVIVLTGSPEELTDFGYRIIAAVRRGPLPGAGS